MSEQSRLNFIGHGGLIENLNENYENSMFVPDANLIMAFRRWQYSKKKIREHPNYQHFYEVTKYCIRKNWVCNDKYIPVNPTLAIFELSRQHIQPNPKSYLDQHLEYFDKCYGIVNISPDWVNSTYFAFWNAFLSTYPSILKTLNKLYSLLKISGKVTNKEILEGCKELFCWILKEKDRLTLAGGPLLYLCVYAIAGSPEARRFLKAEKALNDKNNRIVRNVAWDIIYWVFLEMEYHRNGYDDTIIVTSDKTLSQLLASRINSGPRLGLSSKDKIPNNIVSFGELFPFRLKKVENTKLGKDIEENLISLFIKLQLLSDDSVFIGHL
jgi:hypothetical protein